MLNPLAPCDKTRDNETLKFQRRRGNWGFPAASGVLIVLKDSQPAIETATSTAPPSQAYRGVLNKPATAIFLMCLGSLIFPAMNSGAKWLAKIYPVEQVIFIRILTHFLFMSVLFVPRYGSAIFKSQKPLWQLGASALLFVATGCFFIGIQTIPLAEATIITFLGPLFVTLLAVLLLGEPVNGLRIACIAAGFAGAAIVIRPGSDLFRIEALLIILNAFLYACYQIMTRKLAGIDKPETTAVYNGLVGAVAMAALMPFFWKMPDNLFHLAAFLSLGILGGLGHYAVASAMRYAQASLVAPFHYMQIVFAVFYGWFMFGDWPDSLSFIGCGIIALAGVALAVTETRDQKLPA